MARKKYNKNPGAVLKLGEAGGRLRGAGKSANHVAQVHAFGQIAMRDAIEEVLAAKSDTHEVSMEINLDDGGPVYVLTLRRQPYSGSDF